MGFSVVTDSQPEEGTPLAARDPARHWLLLLGSHMEC